MKHPSPTISMQPNTEEIFQSLQEPPPPRNEKEKTGQKETKNKRLNIKAKGKSPICGRH